jgi:preprotein translocase subunit SecY
MSKRDQTKLSPSLFFQSTELRERLLFTLGALALYRFGAHIPVPGVPRNLLADNPHLSSSLINMYDLFAGGTLGSLSIFALGIGPYISASIVMQLLTPVFPRLKELREEGEFGRDKLKKITRWLTFALAIFESFGLARVVATSSLPESSMPVPILMAVITLTLTASSLGIMWLAEKITKKGLGNGSSLILCAGIASRLPVMIAKTWEAVQAHATPAWGVVMMCAIFTAVAAITVMLQQAMRKLVVSGGRGILSATRNAPPTQLYLPVNQAGVMPIIFASQLICFAGIIHAFLSDRAGKINQVLSADKLVGPVWTYLTGIKEVDKVCTFIGDELHNFVKDGTWEHCLLYGVLIVYFAIFYSSIVLPANDITDSLRKSNRAVAGLRPGRPTREFLQKTIQRLSVIGAAAVAFIAIIPMQAAQFTQVQTLLGFGSTSLIILTGVALDTQRQATTLALNSRYHKRHLLPPSENENSESKES